MAKEQACMLFVRRGETALVFPDDPIITNNKYSLLKGNK